LHDFLQPEVAILSVGKNRFGHPTERVLRILTSTGATVFRTDVDGAISVLSSTEGLNVSTAGKLAR
jgi:competence protein ComEC